MATILLGLWRAAALVQDPRDDLRAGSPRLSRPAGVPRAPDCRRRPPPSGTNVRRLARPAAITRRAPDRARPALRPGAHGPERGGAPRGGARVARRLNRMRVGRSLVSCIGTRYKC